MSKSHFELIARVLSEARKNAHNVLGPNDDPAMLVDYVSARMASALEETNPRFDRARFLAACGMAS